MSLGPFPERIDAFKLFARNAEINARLPVARLQRLQQYLSWPDDDSLESMQVEVDLQFFEDEQRFRVVTGALEGRVSVLCQRCLKPMDVALAACPKITVVTSDEADRELSEDRDGFIAEEEELDLLSLIEDELILALPIAPVHEDSSCNKSLIKLQSDALPETTEIRVDQGAMAQLLKLKESLGKNTDSQD